MITPATAHELKQFYGALAALAFLFGVVVFLLINTSSICHAPNCPAWDRSPTDFTNMLGLRGRTPGGSPRPARSASPLSGAETLRSS